MNETTSRGPRKGPNEVLTAKVDFLSGDPFPRVGSKAYNDEVNVLDRFSRHHRLLATGLVAPLVVCLILLPFRDAVPNTSAALLMVLVVVGVAGWPGCWPRCRPDWGSTSS